jgi:2,4-dienoyl-CoA reductase-like NADH-dependent reductase (Old Yellow Enzyme family)
MLNLFSPLTLGRIRLPNRIVLAALPSGHAVPGGFAGSDLVRYYLACARGGPGMLVIEPTYVLAPTDGTAPHLGLYDDAYIPELRRCISTARQAGPAVLVMLDQPLQLAGLDSRAIGAIGEAFVAAAWRARAAGADGVMFSCADGGPFAQLVSPLSNQRTDRYGGSLDGRLRLLLEVVEGIGARKAGAFIVGVRLNAEEFAPGGLTLHDARVIAQWLAGAGVKLLEVSAAIGPDTPIARFPGWCVPLAAAIKAVVDVPVMVGGLSEDVSLVNNVIREGSADLVALGEVLRARPDWPRYAWATLIQSGAGALRTG